MWMITAAFAAAALVEYERTGSITQSTPTAKEPESNLPLYVLVAFLIGFAL